MLARGGKVLRVSWSRSAITASYARSHLPGMDGEGGNPVRHDGPRVQPPVRRHRVGISVFYRPCGPARAYKIVEYYVNRLLTPSTLAEYAEKALGIAHNPVVIGLPIY